MSILAFKRPEPDGPYATGEAFCGNCGNEWTAVAPAGTPALECPKCGTHGGMFKHPFAFSEGSMVRECQCGNRLFHISTAGHLCPRCGVYQEYR